MGLMKYLALLKAYMRLKIPYIFTFITILLVVSIIFGSFLTINASITYTSLELAKKKPVHVYFAIVMNSQEHVRIDEIRKFVKDIINKTRNIALELSKTSKYSDVNYTLAFTITCVDGGFLFKHGEHEYNTSMISFIYAPNGTLWITPWRNVTGINRNIVSDLGITNFPAQIEVLQTVDQSSRIKVSRLNILFNFTYSRSLLGFNVSGALGAPPVEPMFHLTSNDLENLLENLSKASKYGISASIAVEARFEPNALPLSSIDLTVAIIRKSIDEMRNITVKYLGEIAEVEQSEVMFGPVTIVSSMMHWNTRLDGIMFSGLTVYRSPLLDLINTMRMYQMFQSSFTVAMMSLPILVASWYMLTITGSLVADKMRRGIALMVVRGAPLRQTLTGLSLSKIIIAIIAGLVSVPLSCFVASFFISLEFEQNIIDQSFMTDIYPYIAAIISSLILIYLAVRRSSKYFAEKEYKEKGLAYLTQIYIPPLREEWKPGLLLKILFILGLVDYATWTLGVSRVEIFEYASKLGTFAVILAIVYLAISSFTRIISPIVVPYYIVMFVTHNDRILSFFTNTASVATGGRLKEIIKEFILKSSARIYRISFIISLILAVMISYLGLASSMEEWFKSSNLESMIASNEPTMLAYLTIKATIMSYRVTAYYSILLAFAASILLPTVLVTDLKYELAILRARGASIKDMLRFVYGVIVAIILVGLTVGVLSGLVWLQGSLTSMKEGFSQITGLEHLPSMFFYFNDIVAIIVSILLIMLVPVSIIILDLRKPVAERLRKIA